MLIGKKRLGRIMSHLGFDDKIEYMEVKTPSMTSNFQLDRNSTFPNGKFILPMTHNYRLRETEGMSKKYVNHQQHTQHSTFIFDVARVLKIMVLVMWNF
jgi:hypothetical protein